MPRPCARCKEAEQDLPGQGYCKSCRSEVDRAWRERHPEKRAEYQARDTARKRERSPVRVSLSTLRRLITEPRA